MKDEFKEFIEKYEDDFRVAKSSPHEYLLLDKVEGSDVLVFKEFVRFIRDEGYVNKWNGDEYTYYDFKGYRYWTMGDPVPDTFILNRARNRDRKQLKLNVK